MASRSMRLLVLVVTALVATGAAGAPAASAKKKKKKKTTKAVAMAIELPRLGGVGFAHAEFSSKKFKKAKHKHHASSSGTGRVTVVLAAAKNPPPTAHVYARVTALTGQSKKLALDVVAINSNSTTSGAPTRSDLLQPGESMAVAAAESNGKRSFTGLKVLINDTDVAAHPAAASCGTLAGEILNGSLVGRLFGAEVGGVTSAQAVEFGAALACDKPLTPPLDTFPAIFKV